MFLFLIFRISPLSAEELVNSSNNINFSVEVIPSSCTVEWPGTVDFGHIELSQLNRGVSKEFYLTLKNCNTSSAQIEFSGDRIDYTSNIINNNDKNNNAASNIGIQIIDANNKEVNFSSGFNLDNLSQTQNNRIVFTARLIQHSGIATPGVIDTNINLLITYN
ncbi:fimbrial protein [Salmonella enterica subsp. enterica serovar Schwarzengrund]|nr:type 1 fimbrial protein [Salmonella enterica subsp. enterica serovar Schwarzengrund]EBV9591974.1 type 1 fimbrial protein [Salmonella enterica subsp. enterica serovar Typhimurium var. 5-]ECK4267543.1 type 1 fimbrial protein [Salmonella enterica subsp. enterica serovar Schwarzengrund]EDY4931157.1 type 1 fimbrial protein [Salmonella enterica subsp. enterica serovar Schwarzengrund]EEC2493616.1 fimbrial protein [Salmonella enterica subsp. enterica serovar Schwarzengrund]